MNDMTTKELIREQIQEDILSVLEGYNVGSVMDHTEYTELKDTLCHIVVKHMKFL